MIRVSNRILHYAKNLELLIFLFKTSFDIIEKILVKLMTILIGHELYINFLNISTDFQLIFHDLKKMFDTPSRKTKRKREREIVKKRRIN